MPGQLGQVELGGWIEGNDVLLGEPSEELADLLQVQVLAGPGQRFSVGLTVAEQVTLKSFDHGFGELSGARADHVPGTTGRRLGRRRREFATVEGLKLWTLSQVRCSRSS